MDEEIRKKYWCTCRENSIQPYYDGMHKRTYSVLPDVEITEDQKVELCGCNQTAKGAFCDGSYTKL
ncbi:hypothetical protein CJ263_06785 [Maribacter cobaltidurans]|uniref:Iron-binding zinc finger CDGSH type domain-containing protein n=1 Tax=Maribacter cobaltidurans TaxID=1178778 RepID=A0A223V3I9_9FLAO|nr:hypothetical protein CJ263_06785 [Maribacter cobaltidurans]